MGSGAARRTKPPAEVGEVTPETDIGEVIAVGIGLVFWGIITGGRGGGGMWLDCAWFWPGAEAEGAGGGIEDDPAGGAL